MSEGLPAPLSLHLATNLEFVRIARKVVESVLKAQAWDEETVEEVALVATELVQNAIEHGSRNDGSETVELRFHLDPDAVQIEMLDPGTGKDPTLLLDRDVTQPVPLDEARGRGLFLINRLATRFERRLDEGGGCSVLARMESEAS